MQTRSPRRDARVLIVVHGVLYASALLCQSVAGWRGWAWGLFVASTLAIGFGIPGPESPRSTARKLLGPVVWVLYLGVPIFFLSWVGQGKERSLPLWLTALACVPALVVCTSMWRGVGTADNGALRRELEKDHWHAPFGRQDH